MRRPARERVRQAGRDGGRAHDPPGFGNTRGRYTPQPAETDAIRKMLSEFACARARARARARESESERERERENEREREREKGRE